MGVRRTVLVGGLVWVGLLAGAAGALALPAFAPVTGSPFVTGTFPHSVAFSPSGGLLTTANAGDNAASVFSVSAGGALTQVAGSPFVTGSVPVSVAFSPSGRLLATANNAAHTVSMFLVSAGGALTRVDGSPFATGRGPYSVAFSPSGGLLATANSAGNTVSVFAVSADGGLTAIDGSPFRTGRRSAPVSVAFSPSGALLATADSAGHTVSVFAVSASGALTKVDGSPFRTGRAPNSVAFSPSGALLATADSAGHTVSVFAVSASGALTKVDGSPFSTGRGSAPSAVAFSPSGGLLATANSGADTMAVFAVSAGGALTKVEGSPFATSSGPASVAFGPSGELLTTANFFDDSVSMFDATEGFVIRKVADHSEIAPGRVLSYTIRLRPAGVAGASGTVTDDLSGVLDRATYRNDAHASSGTVTVNVATKRLVWTGTLDPGAETTITYSVRIHRSADGLVSNRVTGPPGSRCASHAPELPCLTVTPIVKPPAPIKPPATTADLALTTTPSTATIHPGGQASFVLAVRNHGPDEATGVTVQDPVAPGSFVHSAQPSQGTCTLTATQLVCRLGSLVSGGEALVSVTDTVAADASGTLVNEASVFGDDPDPDPANNVARSAITVTPLPVPAPDPGPQPISNLTVIKRVNHRTAVVRKKLTYTIKVTNAGPNAAHDVKVIDASRQPLKVVSIHPKQGACATGRPIRCRLGTLRSHAHTTITIRAIAEVAGFQVNAAVATSRSWDPTVRDNLALARTKVRPAVRPPPPPVTGLG